MPRPGPRPYECVRRAWHSERHQPIRGSLIQEVFRIANEIHSPSTKKKKEWQDKLPIVVLKAEEIIYSKANSEAEYMDPKTLWNRANDAINTIIRREECSEDSGQFLQPCIEAALHLGCYPMRASRSQRNNHPRGYLTGNPNLTNVTEGNHNSNSSVAPHNSNCRGQEPQNLALPIKRSNLNNEPFLPRQNCLPGQGAFSSQSYAVYPLYLGAYCQPVEPQLKLGSQPELDMSRNFPLCYGNISMNQIESKDQPIVPINPPECDLSLQLGFPSMQEDEGARIDCFQLSVVGSKHESTERFSLFNESSSCSRDESLDFMVRK